jgi:exonuclease III
MNLPPYYNTRSSSYFLPQTIKLKPEYQHIAQNFAPHLLNTHPLHPQKTLLHPHLHYFIQTHNSHPSPRIIYTLILTMSPSLDTCELKLQYLSNPPFVQIILTHLFQLPIPPEIHLTIPHPFDLFQQANEDLMYPSNTIHMQLYDFIHQHPEPLSLNTMQNKFPFLPTSFLIQALRCHEPIPAYQHPPPSSFSPPPTPHISTHTTHPSQIITWNVASLTTALPNFHDLIKQPSDEPSIIALQETKLTATKSTKYIQKLFPQYKLIFNNTNTPTRCLNRRRIPFNPSRGGLLMFIHKSYASPGNLTKIPTPAPISPYLQNIRINNHPLQPWIILNLYMPSHEEDLHLIPDILDTITLTITQHHNHTIILCGDFNRDIALIGRHHDNDFTPPQEQDRTWRDFTNNLQLTYIATNTSFTRQGGANYTHTSLIDGYYLKTSNIHNYTSHTNTDNMLNPDHFHVHLQILQNSLLARSIPPPTLQHPRILNPIPPNNIENFQQFF